MKILRTLLVLLLCAVLPLSGLAASSATESCPMQMTMDAGSPGMMEGGVTGCESTKPARDTKSKAPLCKIAAPCQLGNSLYHPAAAPVVPRRATLTIPVQFHYTQSLSVREPDGPWRPPRAI